MKNWKIIDQNASGGKQRLHALKNDESTLADGIDNFIDKNKVERECTLSEIEDKINKTEEN